MALSPYFHREIVLPQKGSFLLFGPRMVGKTALLGREDYAAEYNLLHPAREVALRARPEGLLEEVAKLPPGARVLINEIQRVPELLNVVQMGIDEYRLDFVLSGSSARKLKRGRANLLGGRALDLKLYPLTMDEMGDTFGIDRILEIGSLPKIAASSQTGLDDAYGYLDSYVTTYIKEEIQAEAIVRNLGTFQRFLPIAAQSNARTIEFANIARESATPRSTVKEYYQILEDTLLGFFLWPHDRKERRKARPKFYFFDTGVVRALQGRTAAKVDSKERGILFETWVVGELVRINAYMKKRLDFSLWRERNHEVDVLISKAGEPVAGVEIKSGRGAPPPATKKRFGQKFPGVPLYTVGDVPTKDDRRLSYRDFFAMFRAL